jgi:lipid-A-disaccharide synthase-like uncharacterized protein
MTGEMCQPRPLRLSGTTPRERLSRLAIPQTWCDKARASMPSLRLLAVLLFSCVVLHAEPLDQIGKPVDDSVVPGSEVRFKVALSGAKDNVKIVSLKNGSLAYIVKRLGPGTDRILTPDEFSRFYYAQQTTRGWLSTVFNVTSPIGLIWVAVGLSGQLLFTGRMLVQWFTSEKSKRSVVPISFWWMSLVGATMLLIYFIWRRDIVGILGQTTGWIIYARNLALIRRSRA